MTGVDDLIRRAIAEIVQVSCNGGTTSFALPDPRTLWCPGDDRRRPRCQDCCSTGAGAAERVCFRTGEGATGYWRQNVPHAFVWSAPLGGPSFLLAVNAYGEPIGDPHEMILLAAHPAEFALPWEVPRSDVHLDSAAPFTLTTGDDWRKIYIGTLHFPQDAALRTLCRFRRLNSNSRSGASRVEISAVFFSHTGPGCARTETRFLFNRDYKPIFVRSPQGITTYYPNPDARPHFASQRWFYNDGHTEAQKRRRAEAALELCLAGEPLPPHWEAEEVATRPKRRGAKGRG